MSQRRVHRESTTRGHIEVWDEDRRRSLWFDDVILQTEIHLDDPAVLPNAVNQAMLAHLMFAPAPGRVLLAGCGGGGIARWFNARSPQTAGEAVEYSPEVARIARDWFGFPGSETHWTLVTADIRDHLARPRTAYDFILVDIEEGQWTPEWTFTPDFLARCHASLSAAGVLTLNTISRDAAMFARILGQVRSTFRGGTACLRIPAFDNVLIIAFRTPPPAPDPETAGRRWGLPFSRYLADMVANAPGTTPVF